MPKELGVVVTVLMLFGVCRGKILSWVLLRVDFGVDQPEFEKQDSQTNA